MPSHRVNGECHGPFVCGTGQQLCEARAKIRTIFYATHIFDHLAEWATHVLYFSQGKIECCCPLAVAWQQHGEMMGKKSSRANSYAAKELAEYHALVAKGTRCPLYALMMLGGHFKVFQNWQRWPLFPGPRAEEGLDISELWWNGAGSGGSHENDVGLPCACWKDCSTTGPEVAKIDGSVLETKNLTYSYVP